MGAAIILYQKRLSKAAHKLMTSTSHQYRDPDYFVLYDRMAQKHATNDYSYAIYGIFYALLGALVSLMTVDSFDTIRLFWHH